MESEKVEKEKMDAVTRPRSMFCWLCFQEDNQNYEDGVTLLKRFQNKDEAIFEVQIILGATVGGKITRYSQRRERKPAKVFETWRRA